VNVHQNARTTLRGRVLMIERIEKQGWSVERTASAAGVSQRTVRKWLRRWREEGVAGLADRRSRPHRSPRRLAAHHVAAIERLRRARLTSPKIAARLKLKLSTVVVTCRRLGLNRLSWLEPRPPALRYERARPGELLHIDSKKLGGIDGVGHRITGDRRGHRARGVGWEFLHIAVDDHSRLAYTELAAHEDGHACAAFLDRAAAWFARRGVRIERVMTDNAKAYTGRSFTAVCRKHGARHLTTRPYRPQTNGKAERFIQTLLRECAYATPFRSSLQRRKALRRFVRFYNHHRPHAGIDNQPPIARISREQRPC
jgi:transposase InsO family protein